MRRKRRAPRIGSASRSLLAPLARRRGQSPPFPFKEHDDVDPALCAQIKLFGITEIEGGFPHSEIRGSKVVRTSPRLIAAYHVLHRLSAPRHPPNTLKALDRSHYQHPPLGRGHTACAICGCDRKTICFEHIREHRGQADAHNWRLAFSNDAKSDHPHECRQSRFRSINDRICFLFTMTDSTHKAISAQMRIRFIQGPSSLRRALASLAQAPAILPSGGARRDRTDDLMLAKHALSQLSYGPIWKSCAKMVGLGRLELPTSRLSSARSNQLSYKPNNCPTRQSLRISRSEKPHNLPGICEPAPLPGGLVLG